ncbi:MAG TPA: Fe-S cluster assembly protein SufD [Xanthomonadaceae bacterium]|jgi:Fe-S cluster assembly protein SufD|nr:Fe-S cluster assembly protein SufD [Xanthomonadaceae bacterium]
MSALLSSLIPQDESLDPSQRAMLDTVSRDGFPGARSERWKYTSLRALERRSFATTVEVATPPDAATLAHIPVPRLVFVNGFLSIALSDVAGLPEGVVFRPRSSIDVDGGRDATQANANADADADAIFSRLNSALAHGGIWLQIAAAVNCAAPLHLVFVGVEAASDQASHLRHLIAIADGATATIVEHHLGIGAHRHLTNHTFEMTLGANATMHHARMQHEADGATLVQNSNVALSRHATYRRVDLELGAALSRHELKVSLVGQQATFCSGGVLLANGRRHLDTRLDIRHVARDTVCDLRWRGLASDRSRTVFHGGIVIESGADGSDARLSNKNLLLSNDAEIDAQPVLEIHADEVKAAHGATVGQLDEAALFYLRSRGLPLADARQLLIAAFCREPTGAIGDSVLTDLLAHVIEAYLTHRGLTVPEHAV